MLTHFSRTCYTFQQSKRLPLQVRRNWSEVALEDIQQVFNKLTFLIYCELNHFGISVLSHYSEAAC